MVKQPRWEIREVGERTSRRKLPGAEEHQGGCSGFGKALGEKLIYKSSFEGLVMGRRVVDDDGHCCCLVIRSWPMVRPLV